MKRLLYVIMVLLFASTTFLGASAAKEVDKVGEREPVTITYQIWGGEDRLNWQAEAFQELFPEEASWITVDYVSGGANDIESLQKFRLSLASGVDIPDLLQMNNNNLFEWVRSGVVVDLTDRIEGEGIALMRGAKALVEYSDRVWAVPTQVKSKAWFYRPDLFAKAGIDVSRIKSFDDFVQAGKIMRDSLDDTFIVNMGNNPAHYWWDMMMLGYEDLQIANEDGTFNIVSDKRFAEIFQRVATISTSGIALPIDDWASDWQPAIAEGRIASFLTQSWMVEFLRNFAPDQGGLWEIAPWPEFSRIGGQGGVCVIPSASKHQDAAFTYISSIQLTPEGKIAMWKKNGIAPTTTAGKEKLLELLPTLKNDMTPEEWDKSLLKYYGPDFMDKIFATADNISLFAYDPAYGAEKSILLRHLVSYIQGDESLTEALSLAQKDMEQQIGNPYL